MSPKYETKWTGRKMWEENTIIWHRKTKDREYERMLSICINKIARGSKKKGSEFSRIDKSQISNPKMHNFQE